MQAAQIQLKLSLSSQLNRLLQIKAQVMGVPVTQFVKHIILREVERDTYPMYEASEKTKHIVQDAVISKKHSKKVKNVSTYLNSL